MGNILRLAAREKVDGDHFYENCRTMLLYLEHKIESLFKSLIKNYMQPDVFVFF